eukprot:7923305-Pyramimonas_sp.AAC.1
MQFWACGRSEPLKLELNADRRRSECDSGAFRRPGAQIHAQIANLGAPGHQNAKMSSECNSGRADTIRTWMPTDRESWHT